MVIAKPIYIKKRLSALVLIAAVALSAPARAAADYTADQVVEHFLSAANAAPDRGICVGTVEACAPKQAPSSGFDILINFDHASAILSLEARSNLTQVAKALKDPRLSAIQFVVEGHTDALGTEPYNKKLSERRAHSVMSFLIRSGVSRTSITAVGVGENTPRSENTLDPDNRRVEIHISFQ
jgi:outer membrane protein OmpA-like peptidoglycan-associated protein